MRPTPTGAASTRSPAPIRLHPTAARRFMTTRCRSVRLSFGGRETVERPPVAGVSSVRRFSGAAGTGGATPTNSVAQFAVDFAPAGSLFQGLRAIIISADPFFQENKEQLIQAVNNWLAPENSSAGFFWL